MIGIIAVMGHWQCSSEELLHALAESETRMRQEYSASLELIAELNTRNVLAEVGYPSLVAVLRDVLRIGHGEAKRRISHAAAVTEVPVVSGGVVAAALPVTAAAVREGVLGADHLDVIAKALSGLPLHVPDVDREHAEQTMVEAARSMDARTLVKIGQRVRDVMDQDGTSPDDRDLADPVNELHLSTRPNGRLVLRGEFDPETSALVQAVISPLAKPRPSSDTVPDPRSAAHRHGDALAEVVRLAADAGDLPSEGGEKPHVMVTVPLHALRDGIGQAVLDSVGPLDAESARRIACDCRVIPVVLGARSEPLDVGRAGYTVPTAIRRALILRDRGCAFPNCDRPHRQCATHHRQHWADGGPTSLDNTVPLCGRHHRLVHHSQWDCVMNNGRPEFRPPGFIDPTRTLRHNHLHTVTRS